MYFVSSVVFVDFLIKSSFKKFLLFYGYWTIVQYVNSHNYAPSALSFKLHVCFLENNLEGLTDKLHKIKNVTVFNFE